MQACSAAWSFGEFPLTSGRACGRRRSRSSQVSSIRKHGTIDVMIVLVDLAGRIWPILRGMTSDLAVRPVPGVPVREDRLIRGCRPADTVMTPGDFRPRSRTDESRLRRERNVSTFPTEGPRPGASASACSEDRGDHASRTTGTLGAFCGDKRADGDVYSGDHADER